jgi:hypothetical protein
MMSSLLGDIRLRQEVGRGLSEQKDTATPVALPCGGPLARSGTRRGSADTPTYLCVVHHLPQTVDDLVQQLFPG